MTLVRRDSSLDRVWDDFFFGNGVHTSPNYDVVETDEDYRLTFELPGVFEDRISLENKGRILTVEVKKEDIKDKNEVKYLVRNRRDYTFKRSFKLPEDVDTNSVEAEFKNGLLTVEVKKREEVKPKKITFKK